MTRVRDIFTGDVATQEAFRDLNGALARVRDSEVVDGRLIKDIAFAAGDNTLVHRLSRKPQGWFLSRPRGAFGTSGGGGASIYPDIAEPTVEVLDVTRNSPATTTCTYTLSGAPADGTTLIASFWGVSIGTTISSISQTGVTWAKVEGLGTATANMRHEVWIGHTIASAGTTVTLTWSAALVSGYYYGASFMTVPEINGTAATGSVSGESLSTLLSQNLSADLSLPTPGAGDLVYASVAHTSGSWSAGEIFGGWRGRAGYDNGGSGTRKGYAASIIAQGTTPPNAAGQLSVGVGRSIIYAAFPTSLSAVQSAAVTIPHGLREVSRSRNTLVLNSVAAMTADLWVF